MDVRCWPDSATSPKCCRWDALRRPTQRQRCLAQRAATPSMAANQSILGRLGLLTTRRRAPPLRGRQRRGGAQYRHSRQRHADRVAGFGGARTLNSYYSGACWHYWIFTGGGGGLNYAGQISLEPGAGHMRFLYHVGQRDRSYGHLQLHPFDHRAEWQHRRRPPSQRKRKSKSKARVQLVAGGWVANSDRRIKTELERSRARSRFLTRLSSANFRYTDAYRATHPVSPIVAI